MESWNKKKSEQVYTIILTIAFTTLFWLIVGPKIVWNKNPKVKEVEVVDSIHKIDYSERILGRWDPVDIAKDTLVFNYGVMVQIEKNVHSHLRFWSDVGNGNSNELRYALYLDTLIISPEKYSSSKAYIKIYDQDDNTYLEIHNLTDYAGKYMKHSYATAPHKSKPSIDTLCEQAAAESYYE